MILCVTLNAAIDKTIVVDDYQINHIHRPSKVISLAGGKGCNVARVLAKLGTSCAVTGWVGGHAGAFIAEGLSKEGVSPHFVRVSGESRECISVVDPQKGTVTEVYERGKPVSKEEQAQFIQTFQGLLPQALLVALCGSLPSEVPEDFYATLIQLCNYQRVPVFLDTSGAPLKLGLQGGHVALVKPNLKELSALVGREIEQLEGVIIEAKRLAKALKTILVVSLGDGGAVLVSDEKVVRAMPVAVNAVSAVGSGDAMLAGLAIGFLQRNGQEEMLKLGSALGTANTLRLGAGNFDMQDYQNLLIKTEIVAV